MTKDEAEALFERRHQAYERLCDAHDQVKEAGREYRAAKAATPRTAADTAEIVGTGLGILTCGFLVWRMLSG